MNRLSKCVPQALGNSLLLSQPRTHPAEAEPAEAHARHSREAHAQSTPAQATRGEQPVACKVRNKVQVILCGRSDSQSLGTVKNPQSPPFYSRGAQGAAWLLLLHLHDWRRMVMRVPCHLVRQRRSERPGVRRLRMAAREHHVAEQHPLLFWGVLHA